MDKEDIKQKCNHSVFVLSAILCGNECKIGYTARLQPDNYRDNQLPGGRINKVQLFLTC